MLKKTFRYVQLNNGKKKLCIEFQDRQYRLLSTLFFVEDDAFEAWITEHINDVLQGKADRRNISGNVCELVIEKEHTCVYDMLAKDGMGDRCTVSTRELLSLIAEWHERKMTLT